MVFDNDEAGLRSRESGMGGDSNTRGRVFGMFDSSDDAVDAIRSLQAAGFGADRIGIAMQDRAVQAEIIDATGSEAAEGAKTGAVSGGVVGGLVGRAAVVLVTGAVERIGATVAGGTAAVAAVTSRGEA